MSLSQVSKLGSPCTLSPSSTRTTKIISKTIIHCLVDDDHSSYSSHEIIVTMVTLMNNKSFYIHTGVLFIITIITMFKYIINHCTSL